MSASGARRSCIALATAALLAAGCSGSVSTAPIPTTAAGPTVCAMLSEADLATVFGTDDFVVDRSMQPFTNDGRGRLMNGGCVVNGDDLRLRLTVFIKLGDARTELEKGLAAEAFAGLPGLRRFSPAEGSGGVYRESGTQGTVQGVLLRGDYEISLEQLTGIPAERDRLADARALILQVSNALMIPAEAGAPRPTPVNP